MLLDHVVVKLYFTNAFNSIQRDIVLDAYHKTLKNSIISCIKLTLVVNHL